MAEPVCPKSLEVMADYCSSGIWGGDPQGPFRHGMIKHESLGLPIDLTTRFEQWIAWHDLNVAKPGFDRSAFDAAGRKLAKDLQTFLGRGTTVTYTPLHKDSPGCLAVLQAIWFKRWS